MYGFQLSRLSSWPQGAGRHPPCLECRDPASWRSLRAPWFPFPPGRPWGSWVLQRQLQGWFWGSVSGLPLHPWVDWFPTLDLEFLNGLICLRTHFPSRLFPQALRLIDPNGRRSCFFSFWPFSWDSGSRKAFINAYCSCYFLTAVLESVRMFLIYPGTVHLRSLGFCFSVS